MIIEISLDEFNEIITALYYQKVKCEERGQPERALAIQNLRLKLIKQVNPQYKQFVPSGAYLHIKKGTLSTDKNHVERIKLENLKN